MEHDDLQRFDEAMLDTLELIGEGLRSAVYVLDESTALKVYNDGVPASWAEYEARLTNVANECGAPAPSDARVVVVGNRPGLAMELIEGPSLWTMVDSATESELIEFGRVVAQAQFDLATIAPSVALPHQWDRLHAKLGRAVERFPELAPAFELLGARSARGSDVVCHGDLHLRNVLSSPARIVLVDWFDASRGELAIEVARTLVMFDVEPQHAGRVQTVRASYLDTVLAGTRLAMSEIEPWLAVQEAARIGEGLDHDRAHEIREMIDRALR